MSWTSWQTFKSPTKNRFSNFSKDFKYVPNALSHFVSGSLGVVVSDQNLHVCINNIQLWQFNRNYVPHLLQCIFCLVTQPYFTLNTGGASAMATDEFSDGSSDSMFFLFFCFFVSSDFLLFFPAAEKSRSLIAASSYLVPLRESALFCLTNIATPLYPFFAGGQNMSSTGNNLGEYASWSFRCPRRVALAACALGPRLYLAFRSNNFQNFPTLSVP